MGNDQSGGARGGGGGAGPSARANAASASAAANAAQDLSKKLKLLEKRCVGGTERTSALPPRAHAHLRC